MVADEPEAVGRVLVVGIGDVQRRDEGVGVWVVRELRRLYELPPNVETVEVERVDLDLLDALEEAVAVLAVDCVYAEAAAGAIFRVPLAEFARPADVPESLHEASLLEALGVVELLGERPPGVLIAVQVGEGGPGSGLSAAAAAKVPAVVDVVVNELARLGIAVRRSGGERA